MNRPTDFGAGALYPFCPWEPGEKGRPRGGERRILYARDGDPNRVVAATERSAREGRALRAQSVDTLEWYYQRKPELIPRPLYSAGRRLRDIHDTCLRKAGIGAFDFTQERVSGLGHRDVSADALAAMQELGLALDYVGGPELDMLLLEVVCRGARMDGFERRHGWRAGGGQIALRVALYRLALHYGFVEAPRRRARF